MCENIEEYLKCVIREGGQLEVDTSHSGKGWEIRGRADHIYTTADNLVVQDFKYGWKIVEPENNYTLMSHTIGWLIKNPNNFVKKACFEIFQPRPYHPEGKMRKWWISVEDLWNIYANVMLPALENPKNTLQTSEHCYKCKSMTQCPAMQIANMNAIDVAEKAYNSELDNKNLCFTIDEGKRAIEVLKQNLSAYEELALHRIKTGQNVPNYSLQTDLGNTTWKKDITPEFIQMITGVDVSKKQLKTPKQAGLLGLSKDVVDTFTERPTKGVKLVRVDMSKKVEKLLGKRE
jgi:hypothetical protein